MKPIMAWAVLVASCASSAPAPEPQGAAPPPPARPPRRPGGPSGPGAAELEAAIEAAKKEDLETVTEKANAAITKNPQLEHAYLLLGSAHAMKEDGAGERKAYERGLAALPRSAPLHKELGFLELREGRYPEAVTAYEKAIELGAKDPETQADLAYAYALAGRGEDGVKAAKAAAADARCFHCAMMLGEILLSTKDNAGAAASYEAAAKLDPTSADAQIGLAKSHFLAGRYDEARSIYDRLLASEPDNGRYLVQAAQVAAAAGRWADAAAHYGKVAAANPDDPQLLEQLLQAQEKSGDKKGAAQTKKRLAAARKGK